jgi:hypothetical protein
MALPAPAWAALSISTFARFLGLHLGKVLGSSDCDDLNHIASIFRDPVTDGLAQPGWSYQTLAA